VLTKPDDVISVVTELRAVGLWNLASIPYKGRVSASLDRPGPLFSGYGAFSPRVKQAKREDDNSRPSSSD
jgi:hypothetical protein